MTPSSIDVVQTRLAQSRANLQADVDQLRSELGNSLTSPETNRSEESVGQEQPNDARMGVIQELISVGHPILVETTCV